MVKQVLLDTLEEDCEDEYYNEYCKDELENFISRYEKRYHTTVNCFLLIGERESRYGWIGGNGKKEYRLIENIEQLFCTRSDYMQVYIENNLIHVNYFDHDGVDYSVVKLIPRSVEEKIYDDLGCYACELDYVDILQKRGQLKPTKFWR